MGLIVLTNQCEMVINVACIQLQNSNSWPLYHNKPPPISPKAWDVVNNFVVIIICFSTQKRQRREAVKIFEALHTQNIAWRGIITWNGTLCLRSSTNGCPFIIVLRHFKVGNKLINYNYLSPTGLTLANLNAANVE